MTKTLVWIKNILILILSLFFLIIGINTLLGSYHLNNPIEFVMYFFSASLLILVCIVGLVYFFFQFFPKKQKNEIDNAETK
jgi:antibiotic biosynthesis monooxygenase (ABM) superfamily enzyme